MTVCSAAFHELAVLEARMREMPDLRIVTVPHPVAGIAADAAREKGRAVTSAVVAALTDEVTDMSKSSEKAETTPTAPTAPAGKPVHLGPAYEEKTRALLQGAIDIHLHSAPDGHMGRRAGAAELAEHAARLGMGGLVLKDHNCSTVGLASTVDGRYGQVRVVGGVTLNEGVGGLNPAAVETAVSAGGRVVWMPTTSSTTHRAFKGGQGGITILDADGKLRPEVDQILEIARSRDVAVGSGHLSIQETFALVERCVAAKVTPLVTHANTMKVISGMEISHAKDLAALGAYVELSLISIMPMMSHHPPADLAVAVTEIGAERCILSTDFGQLQFPIAPEGMGMGIAMLLKLGVREDVIGNIVRRNPRQVLRL